VTSVGVRRAASGDVDAIVDLFIAVVDEEQWLGTQPPVDRESQRARFLEETTSDRCASFVALVDDELVGHARIDMAPYGVAGLGMMVDARWRGLGVGGALVRSVIDAAGGLGAHKIALQVWPHNEAARRLYLRHGFVEEGVLRRHYPRRNGQLWDAVIMGLVLDETAPGSPY
jgi:RimJ/RimL family protein N-acetyltransferase